MPDAIIIYGNAQRFSTHASILRSHLIREAGVSRGKIRTLDSTHAAETMIEYRIGMAAAQRTKSPLLISYVGHGSQEGWAFDDERTYTYMRLALFLLVGRRPVVVVNDTCHSFSAVTAFELFRVSQERVSLIAACGDKGTTTGGLSAAVTESWENRKPLAFAGALRWGANHDHLYYPPAQAKSA